MKLYQAFEFDLRSDKSHHQTLRKNSETVTVEFNIIIIKINSHLSLPTKQN